MSLDRQDLKTDLGQLENEISKDNLNYLNDKANKLASSHKSSELIVGKLYFSPLLAATVRLESLANAKGKCKVRQIDNNMSWTIEASGLITIDTEKDAKEVSIKLGFTNKEETKREEQARYYEHKKRQQKVKTVATSNELGKSPLELMLLGENASDACLMLDKHIDQSQILGLHEIRIVHGKGSGILRKAISDFLRKDKRIASFALAPFGQGDSGVTIAKLKS